MFSFDIICYVFLLLKHNLKNIFGRDFRITSTVPSNGSLRVVLGGTLFQECSTSTGATEGSVLQNC